METSVCGADIRPGQQIPDARQHHCSRSPAGSEWKKGAADQALGRSRGGLTTKVMYWPMRSADPCGSSSPSARSVTSLRRWRYSMARSRPCACLIYDGNALCAEVSGLGAQAVIPSSCCRKIAIPHEALARKHRNHIDRASAARSRTVSATTQLSNDRYYILYKNIDITNPKWSFFRN